jgi:hypothetical protein
LPIHHLLGASTADGLKTDPYLALEFNINTNNQPIENFSAAFSDMNDKVIKDVALSKDNVVKTLENGWAHVVVPLSDLNPSNAPVLRIQIKNATQNQLDTSHIDDVQLSGCANDAASPAPSEGNAPAESPAPSETPATTPVTETGSDISGLHVQGNQLR